MNSHYVVRPEADADLDHQAFYLAEKATPGVGHRFLIAAHETFLYWLTGQVALIRRTALRYPSERSRSPDPCIPKCDRGIRCSGAGFRDCVRNVLRSGHRIPNSDARVGRTTNVCFLKGKGLAKGSALEIWFEFSKWCRAEPLGF